MPIVFNNFQGCFFKHNHIRLHDFEYVFYTQEVKKIPATNFDPTQFYLVLISFWCYYIYFCYHISNLVRLESYPKQLYVNEAPFQTGVAEWFEMVV